MRNQFFMSVVICLPFAVMTGGQEPTVESVYSTSPQLDALPSELWQQVDRSVEQGLAFLASQQLADGSFPSAVGGQPAVTSLAALAFLSAGHAPGSGPYGDVLSKAIDYVLQCQEPDGLLALDKLPLNDGRQIAYERRPHTATYNHAISGIMLSEAYGQSDKELSSRLETAISSALAWTRKLQQRKHDNPKDAGGWRYLQPWSYPRASADLSVTGWFIMFYRSAKNANFDVPKEHVDKAVEFAIRCHDSKTGAFFYATHGQHDRMISRSMTGAGLLAISLAGRQDEQIARSAIRWILDHPFDRYNGWSKGNDRFHYGAYYCSHAMYVVGGEHWAEFYQVLARTLVDHQRKDGGWEPEARYADKQFGRTYSTALAILSLTPPSQLLPIYQR